MVIGVLLFTLSSSTIIECSISESINIFKNKENEQMIEKIQVKYLLKGDPRRFLGLLSDTSIQENLRNEHEFIKKLPM